MQGTTRIVAFVLMVLILVFAIIHLGVGIGIVARLNYSGIFRPERGLAAFNIVISIYGLLVGGFGLFAVLTERDILCKIVAFASIALAFFSIISLITALIINSKAVDYSSSHFVDQMNNYKGSQDSRDIVDKIQTKYTCCGDNTWLDWAAESLNATGTSSGVTTAAPSGGGAGTTAAIGGGGAGTTAAAGGGGAGTTAAVGGGGAGAGAGTTPIAASGAGAGTGTTAAAGIQKRNVFFRKIRDTDTMDNDLEFQRSLRQKRQSQTSYGGILGLPTSFVVTMPQSCCTTDLSSTDNLNNLYCLSFVGNGVTNFHLNGCGKILAQLAVGQSLGIAVINSFLFLLALAAVPLLLQVDQSGFSLHNDNLNESMPQNKQPQPYTNGVNNAAVYDPGTSYNNYNTEVQTYY